MDLYPFFGSEKAIAEMRPAVANNEIYPTGQYPVELEYDILIQKQPGLFHDHHIPKIWVHEEAAWRIDAQVRHFQLV